MKLDRFLKLLCCLWIGLLVFFCGCQREVKFDDNTIAIVGDQKVSLKEFRLFYEFDPNFGLDSTGYPALFDELLKLVYHEFAYSKAENDGLLKDSLFSKLIEWEKSRIM